MENASTPPNRFSPELWALIKKLWEETPGLSHDKAGRTAAETLRVTPPSKATIVQRAKREGWLRVNADADSSRAPDELDPKKKLDRRELARPYPSTNALKPVQR